MVPDGGLKKLLNGAGFVFQLAVEAQIADNRRTFQCNDLIREHPWFHKQLQNSGFIDLVVTKGVGRFVVECKRSKNARWVFLDTAPGGSRTSAAQVYWHCRLSESKVAGGWDDVGIFPECPESQFCCIRGAEDNKQVLLDRICSDLVAATEALSAEELEFDASDFGQHYVYMPVLVTNAELVVGNFDPSTVNLGSGEVEDASFEVVGAVRYRKALTAVSATASVSSLVESNARNERTVFIVNATHLIDWLKNWKPVPRDSFRGFVWDQVKRQFGA